MSIRRLENKCAITKDTSKVKKLEQRVAINKPNNVEATIIKIAVIFSPTSMFVKDFLKKMIIKYTTNRTATEVNLASQTHHVPHMGLPQRDPVNNQINVNVAPIGATAELTINPKGTLNARATTL